MWEAKEVTLTLRLPRDIADQAEEIQILDPEFLSRVVLYGLTRRSIYSQLRERAAGEDEAVRRTMFPDPVEEEAKRRRGEDLGGRVVPIEESEGRRILAENRVLDSEEGAEKRRDELERLQRRSGLPVQRRPIQ